MRQQSSSEPSSLPRCAGMFVGAALVGVHMAMTHGICLSMISAYIPSGEIPGLGRVSGTVWSFTDFVLGKVCLAAACRAQEAWPGLLGAHCFASQ